MDDFLGERPLAHLALARPRGKALRSLTAAWAILAAAPAAAQMTGAPDLAKYTPQNPYERFQDGRPRVPDLWINRLREASTTEVWDALAERGYRHQFEGGWVSSRPERKLIGRVFTARFMPERPDVNRIIEGEAADQGLDSHPTKRIIEMLQPGDVLVVDVMGRIEYGQFGGDNLIYGLFVKTGNGFIVDGSFRDLDGVFEHNVPVYARGHHPGVRGRAMLTGINVPVRIGDAIAMPGDIVVADRTGVIFIPPHLAEAVVREVEAQQFGSE